MITPRKKKEVNLGLVTLYSIMKYDVDLGEENYRRNGTIYHGGLCL